MVQGTKLLSVSYDTAMFYGSLRPSFAIISLWVQLKRVH